MAAQGMIRPEGDGFRVVFPYGGQEYGVHSVKSDQEADVVLQCLMTWAKEDWQRSLEQSAAGCGGGVPATMGSPQQLVQELQACVDYINTENSQTFDADAPAASLLMWAAADEGHASVVRQLLAWDPARALANLNAVWAEQMPLHLAALGGHAAVFRLLLAAAPEAATHTCRRGDGHGGEYSEWSAMHSTAWGGSTAVIEALLEIQPAMAGWTSDGHTPLHAACSAGHLEAARVLLRAAPATAIAADGEGEVPLHWAAAIGAEAVVELLLEAAPGMATAEASSGQVPLHLAATRGAEAVVETLLQAAPATVTATDSNGRVPLHSAAACGAEAVVKLLLEAAPSMATATDVNGKVPLHFAAASGRVAAMELLLQAAPTAALMEDAGGRHPFHIALQDRDVFVDGYLDAVPNLDAARLLLPASGLSPAQLLEALASKPAAQPLYADLAAHFPLSAADWQRVPTPCASLVRVLPAVLARSDAEARQLVQHLPAAERQHLRLAALCLGRTQRVCRVFLPAPLVRAILLQCLL